jgi:hypothetical protein
MRIATSVRHVVSDDTFACTGPSTLEVSALFREDHSQGG